MDGEQPEPRTNTATILKFLYKWRVPVAALGTAALYYGCDAASNYVPVTPLATMGGAMLGMHFIPKMWKDAEGIRRFGSDINKRAKEGGVRKVMREGAKDAAGGVGEGIKEDLGVPLINAAGEKLAPHVKSFGEKWDKVSNGVKNLSENVSHGLSYLKWASIAGAGLFGLWLTTKILHNYFKTSKLEVVVKKAQQNGIFGRLSRQIIVDEQTRDRLNLFLHTNLKVKQSILSGNEEARFRTALLWGPSGCGKRMFAQEMANFARMDYYEIPASSFHKFKDADVGKAIEEFFKREVMK